MNISLGLLLYMILSTTSEDIKYLVKQDEY